MVAAYRVAAYREIADHIANQISTGKLTAGQRVPSTRQIVADHAVAMATATKVLAELRRRGLVRAVAGVGTVVTGSHSARGEPTAELADPAILAVAVRIADDEGWDAVTMRRVAAELGAAPMSLYRHVSDKQDLLLRMREWVYARQPLSAKRPAGWRAQLELLARHLWTLYQDHPWLARTASVTRPAPGPSQMAISEWSLRALSDLGLPRQTVLHLHLSLFNFVHGSASSLETESRETADSGLDSDHWMALQEARSRSLITREDFPYSARLFLADDLEFDLHQLFEAGLALLLDGFAVLIGRTRHRRS